MFAALGRLVVRNPWKVIVAWVVVAAAVIAFSPRLDDIINPDQTSFLPDSYESVQAAAHDAAPPGTSVLVGGTTSATADLREATTRDLVVIFPVAGVLIALILALLLRSLVAPIYLMLAVMLGYAASLGATVFVFQGIGGEPGCCSCCRSSSTCSWWRSAPTTTSS